VEGDARQRDPRVPASVRELSAAVTLEERIDALESRASILELIARYAAGVACRDREQILSTFTPDGVFEVAGKLRVAGVDDIREYMKNMKPNTPHLPGFDEATGSTPLSSNVQIFFDGPDKARSTSMSVVCHAGGRGGEPIVLVRGTEYQDELVRVDGAWLFTHRLHRTVWDFEAKGSALTPPPAWTR
jgi:uncharacterized protein (TIGR02246 family)